MTESARYPRVPEKPALDGVEGKWYAESNDYDLIVLDIMLPGCDGLEILRHLRAKGKEAPVLLLTAALVALSGTATGVSGSMAAGEQLRELACLEAAKGGPGGSAEEHR